MQKRTKEKGTDQHVKLLKRHKKLLGRTERELYYYLNVKSITDTTLLL